MPSWLTQASGTACRQHSFPRAQSRVARGVDVPVPLTDQARPLSPWTRWQQGKWRCSWRAPTPDHSAQRSHHPFSRNSLPFMNVRHSPKLHFSPHSAPLSSRLGTERVAFCFPGCQKGRGGGVRRVSTPSLWPRSFLSLNLPGPRPAPSNCPGIVL